MNKKIEIKIWEEGAENGSMFSMFALGFSYANGDFGLPQDDKIALEWFKKAADKGHPVSRAIVEIYYESGILDFKNKEQKILEWASKGKEEEVLAMLLLGNIYETGLKNMENDQVKALEWYKKAAEKDSKFKGAAIYEIAHYYESGLGDIQQDKKKP